VMDLAEGHLKMLEFLIKNDSNFINLNLGTGIGTSVMELVEIFKTVNDVNIPYRFVDRRPGDIDEIIADNSLAKELINWIPKRNIYDMCRDGYNWQINNPGGLG